MDKLTELIDAVRGILDRTFFHFEIGFNSRPDTETEYPVEFPDDVEH